MKHIRHPGIRKVIRDTAPALKTLAADIHAHPELGFHETHACRLQVELLRAWRFSVKNPFVRLPTAYTATRGRGDPVFCFMAEYDALPDIGHGCGHNLIAPAALGAGRALAAVLEEEKRPGTVVVMGTPAEENLAGKVLMVRAGALRGLDAVMMAHPGIRTIATGAGTAAQLYTVRFHGQAAHAAGSPHHGRNALEALMLVFQGINAWRQQMPETSRVHGIIREGGASANIVPDRASALFYLRSPKASVLRDMCRTFTQIAEGAGLMTGTRAECTPEDPAYRARLPNRSLDSTFLEVAAQLGLDPDGLQNQGRGSSDFGDVSQELPGAHVYFRFTKANVPGHSPAWTAQAGTAYARQQMVRAAEAMAHVGYRFCVDPAFRAAVQRDFQLAKESS